VQAQLAARHSADVSRATAIASGTTKAIGLIGAVVIFGLCLAVAAAILNSLTGWLAKNTIWLIFTLYAFGLFSLYHQVMNFLERPKIGLRSVLSFLAARLFWIKIKRAGLDQLPGLEKTTFENGKVTLPADL
jgi:hypothetical protein